MTSVVSFFLLLRLVLSDISSLSLHLFTNKMNVQSDGFAVADDENLALLNSDNETQVTIRARCMYFLESLFHFFLN
jgi:hypothetical protein